MVISAYTLTLNPEGREGRRGWRGLTAQMSEKTQAGCSECGVVFTKTGNLYRHYRTQHGIKITTRVCDPAAGKVPCPHCERLFSKTSNMTRHCRIVHNVRKRMTVDEDSEEECSETSGLQEMSQAVLREARLLDEADLDQLLMKARETRASLLRLTENTNI